MVGICQRLVGATIQKRLPQKARVVECVCRYKVVKGAVDDMVSRELG